jgi:hypothetical protein
MSPPRARGQGRRSSAGRAPLPAELADARATAAISPPLHDQGQSDRERDPLRLGAKRAPRRRSCHFLWLGHIATSARSSLAARAEPPETKHGSSPAARAAALRGQGGGRRSFGWRSWWPTGKVFGHVASLWSMCLRCSEECCKCYMQCCKSRSRCCDVVTIFRHMLHVC